MTLRLRIAKVEAALDMDDELARLADDELQILLLDLSRRIVATEDGTPDELAESVERVAEIEASIHSHAAYWREPGNALRLEQLRHDRPGYVPPVCGLGDIRSTGVSDWPDMNKPGLMERRAAIMARPDIQALHRHPGAITK